MVDLNRRSNTSQPDDDETPPGFLATVAGGLVERACDQKVVAAILVDGLTGDLGWISLTC